jgi:hypothetical protein
MEARERLLLGSELQQVGKAGAVVANLFAERAAARR